MKTSKLVSFCLVIMLILTSFPTAVSAADTKGKIYSFIPEVDSYYSEAEDYIADALRKRESTIDVTKFNIPKDDIIYIYRSIMFDNPDIFYVDSAFIPYKFDNQTDTIAILSPSYIFTKSKIPTYINKFNNTVKKYIKGIDSTYSAMQKALILHDRIVVNCKYKYENLKSYTAYNALVNGKAVCEGYSRAYCYLLSLVGVDSKCVNNDDKEHCWNLVKLGGKWYHADLTGDDPTPDTAGYLTHKYFLISSSKLNSYNKDKYKDFENDLTYNSDFSCNSTNYHNSFFRNINAQIIYYKKAYYYLNTNYKNKHYTAFIKKKGSSKKIIKVIKDKWINSRGGRILNSFCTLCELNNRIYFNTKRKIYRYNLSSGKLKRLMTLPKCMKKNFIGIKVKDSKIYTERKNADLKGSVVKKMIKISSKNKATVLPFLKSSSISIKKKKSKKLIIYYGSGKTKYKSSNKKIARITKKGKIKARKKGKCTITAVRNGITMKCKVKVK